MVVLAKFLKSQDFRTILHISICHSYCKKNTSLWTLLHTVGTNNFGVNSNIAHLDSTSWTTHHKKIKQPIYALEAPDSQQFQFLLLHSHPRKQARTILLINKKSHQLRKTCTYYVSICSVMPTLQVPFYLHDISIATAVINIFSCLGIFGKTLLLEDIVLWEFGHK